MTKPLRRSEFRGSRLTFMCVYSAPTETSSATVDTGMKREFNLIADSHISKYTEFTIVPTLY